MPRLVDDFVPALGFDDAHAQTVFGSTARPKLKLPLTRRRIETPDDDFFDVDVLEGRAGAPTVLILHGLEGSSSSGYVLQVLAGCQARGWHGWALNARACSGEPNRQAASYSSGDFRDAKWLLDTQLSGACAVVGFSLGASATLNLLAKAPNDKVRAAVAVSTPFELGRGAMYLDSDQRFARVYLSNFLVTMKQKALQKAARFPHLLDAAAIAKASTIRDFDDLVTAPLFGFSSAADYYAQCSTAPQLHRITTPTLLLSAHDDTLAPPLLPASAFEQPNLEVLLTAKGGHVGFVARSVLRPVFWAEQRLLEWLDTKLS